MEDNAQNNEEISKAPDLFQVSFCFSNPVESEEIELDVPLDLNQDLFSTHPELSNHSDFGGLSVGIYQRKLSLFPCVMCQQLKLRHLCSTCVTDVALFKTKQTRRLLLSEQKNSLATQMICKLQEKYSTLRQMQSEVVKLNSQLQLLNTRKNLKLDCLCRTKEKIQRVQNEQDGCQQNITLLKSWLLNCVNRFNEEEVLEEHATKRFRIACHQVLSHRRQLALDAINYILPFEAVEMSADVCCSANDDSSSRNSFDLMQAIADATGSAGNSNCCKIDNVANKNADISLLTSRFTEDQHIDYRILGCRLPDSVSDLYLLRLWLFNADHQSFTQQQLSPQISHHRAASLLAGLAYSAQLVHILALIYDESMPYHLLNYADFCSSHGLSEMQLDCAVCALCANAAQLLFTRCSPEHRNAINFWKPVAHLHALICLLKELSTHPSTFDDNFSEVDTMRLMLSPTCEWTVQCWNDFQITVERLKWTDAAKAITSAEQLLPSASSVDDLGVLGSFPDEATWETINDASSVPEWSVASTAAIAHSPGGIVRDRSRSSASVVANVLTGATSFIKAMGTSMRLNTS